jgi:hypothetical protein
MVLRKVPDERVTVTVEPDEEMVEQAVEWYEIVEPEKEREEAIKEYIVDRIELEVQIR